MVPELIEASVVDVGVPNDQLEDVDQSEVMVEIQLSIIGVGMFRLTKPLIIDMIKIHAWQTQKEY